MLTSVPTDRPIYDNEIATYWFEDGILVSRSKSPKRTVDLIDRNVKFVRDFTGGKRYPLMIYLANSPVPDKETRAHSAKMLPEIYSAVAMIAKPGLANLIMKLVFSMKKSPIPMKSFTDPEEARRWLKGLLLNPR